MRILILLALVMAFTGCAHKQKEDIKKKVEQSNVKDSETLSGTIDEAIEKSPDLNQEQKEELRKILADNKQKAMALTEQSYKLRGVLIQELLSGNPDYRKIRILKRDIKKVEDNKLKNTFDTVELITKKVSKQSDSQRFTEPLLNMDKVY